MSDKTILKTAIDLAEKEIQEKEINRVKDIIKDYLKELHDKMAEEAIIHKEVVLLKKDIDDFKSGRLDKIVERQKIEPLAPKIVVITRVEKEYVPYQPWYSPFHIQYPLNVPYTPAPIYVSHGQNNIALCATTTGATLVNSANSNYSSQLGKEITGNVFRNFASGSYDIGGEIINL